MTRLASTIALSFVTACSLPLTAIAQPLPFNDCGYIYTEDGYQAVCSFHPTMQHDLLVVMRDSIQQASRGSSSVDFIYMNIPHPSQDPNDGYPSYAQVDCNRPDHWHRFTDTVHSEMIPAESNAAQRMVRFVCTEAGLNQRARR